ncbi:hypothetical protein [Ancylobacter amanitiformis]|uniref:Lectin-like protein BA14k n=1 Tax=Ancylobacter amanitiformis TaxID=217069 RepID=A0ABU0LVR5_9HYPH|nr:hypothetical protein [Ancylobacter amanitiformis]MDQ0512762.1 hypothetical protein [Ancylobacter amanitiformis]
MFSFARFRFATTTKLAALALAGLTLASTVPAAAGGWDGGPGPRHGWGGPGPRHGWGGGGPGWGRGPGYYYGPRNNGGAVAAGIIGGLVVGGIAAAAANNYYNQPRCWTETQTVYDNWGRPFYRDVRMCR